MSAFEDAFGVPPAVTLFSPGRVNLIGEHTDYNGGMVLPTALALGVAVELSPRPDDRVRVASDRFGGVAEARLGEPATGAWHDYVVGALTLARGEGLATGGADVALVSTLPDGAGLSSSAAVAVGVLRAAAEAAGMAADPVHVAMLAQRVENEHVGVPCGVMDQMAVALAAPGEALALDTLTLAHEAIALPAGHRFVVLHSGIRRRLDEGRYAERRAECEAAARALGADHLCLLTGAQLGEAERLPEPLSRRARHCATEHRRTVAAADALRAGAVARFGALMSASHASMRDDFEVSLPPIDALVAACLAGGALGARLTGGGFGGCVVALAGAGRTDEVVRHALSAHPGAYRVA